MSRIRTVKPGYFTHPEIVVLTIPARLLFLSLLTQADDEGRLYDQVMKIHANAFGERDVVDASGLLAELDRRGRIVRYEAEGRRCIQVVHFKAHQVISHARPSTIPPVPEDYRRSDPIQVRLPEASRIAAGHLPAPVWAPPGTLPEASGQEWNGSGMEGNGKELPPGAGDEEESTAFDDLDSFFDDEPRPARGLTEQQDSLLADLKLMDPVWEKLTFGGVNKLNQRWGKGVVLEMFRHAREEKAKPADPYPWGDAVCAEIAAKQGVSA